MWVEITHDVTNRLSRFTIAFVIGIAILIHGIKEYDVERVSDRHECQVAHAPEYVFGVASKNALP